MKLFSIDIETTGLNPKTDQILEFGCVFVDTDDTSSRRCFVRRIRHEQLSGSPFALDMNQRLIKALIADSQLSDDDHDSWKPRPGIDEDILAISEDQLLFDFQAFIGDCGVEDGKINVVGKNFMGFDMLFLLESNQVWEDVVRRRVIDPAILFVREEDESLPNLTTCIERHDGSFPDNLHDALYDAGRTLDLVLPYFSNLESEASST